MDAIAICSPCSAPEVFFASQENFPDSNYKRELYRDAIPHLPCHSGWCTIATAHLAFRHEN